MSSGTKSKSKSVSLEPELWDRIEAKSQTKFGGNRSAYLRELALADLAGTFDPGQSANNVLIELARRYHPTLAKDLEHALAHTLEVLAGDRPINQERIIVRFLEALAEACRAKPNPDAPKFNPEEKFELADAQRIAEWEGLTDQRLEKVVELLADKLHDKRLPMLPLTVELDQLKRRHSRMKRSKRGAGPAPAVSATG